jgi:hypothetical protein
MIGEYSTVINNILIGKRDFEDIGEANGSHTSVLAWPV